MGRSVLVWDAPNIDSTLASIIDGKPTARERPDLAVLGKWLVEQAGPECEVEGCIFVNVAPHVAGPLRGWVLWLLEQGFRVFAKPKYGESDVDVDMVDHLARRYDEGGLDTVFVGSHDADSFVGPLTEMLERGVSVTVLAFTEFAGELAVLPAARVVDLETIDGLFGEALPRIALDSLPPEGRWFEPTGTLLPGG